MADFNSTLDAVLANQWVQLYLLGVATAAVMYIFAQIVRWALMWLTKGFTFQKNVKKLDPSPFSVPVRFLGHVALFLFEILFSWISVVLVMFKLIAKVLNVLREALTPVPADVKSLRFPLYNNPNLSAEGVWARIAALNVKAGQALNAVDLADDLSIRGSKEHPFNSKLALDQLADLDVVKPEVIEEARADAWSAGEHEEWRQDVVQHVLDKQRQEREEAEL